MSSLPIGTILIYYRAAVIDYFTDRPYVSAMKLTRPAEVGAIVRDYRRERQMRQAELAKRLGVSPKWLSQFENGKATAQIGLVIRVLHELGFELRVEPAASVAKRKQHHVPKSIKQRFSINDVVDD